MSENINYSGIIVYDTNTGEQQESFSEADNDRRFLLFRERYDRKFGFLGEEFVDEFAGWQMAGLVRVKNQLRISPTEDLRAITGNWKFFFDDIDRLMELDK